jgi:hypothetical protein
VGLGLVIVFWSLNWGLSGLRTHWGFFPLWLGYCLVIDAWTWRRTGTSLWARGHRAYVVLFFASIPVWWLFELINLRTGNWSYLGRSDFGDLEYALLASISFSTVMPAVFGTAEWVRSFGWVERLAFGYTVRRGGAGFALVGGALLTACLVWPLYFFPFVWLSLFLIVDPVNDRLGNPSIFRYLRRGEWRPVVALGLGCLICGFFWEMWNFYSFPKWQYQIPFVGFFRIFEMPLLGYGGYLPFSLELFALYHLMAGVAGRREATLRLGELDSEVASIRKAVSPQSGATD